MRAPKAPARPPSGAAGLVVVMLAVGILVWWLQPEDVAKLAAEEIELMPAYADVEAGVEAYAKQKKERIGVPQ